MISVDLFPHTLTVITPTIATDRYSNETLSYDVPPATSRTIGGFMQPNVSTENTVDRSAVTYAYVVYTNDSLDARDRVIWEGHTFEVDGPPRRWDTPAGAHHYETYLRVTEG
jgi:hypothetical protein